MIRTILATALAAILLAAQPSAQAGVIEDLLAIPAIQSLLGRLPELDPLVKRCEDPTYRQRNATMCEQASQAQQLARMPPELRAVMASPPAAASLRELCLAATGTVAFNGYLCTQLYRYDASFQQQSQLKQILDMQNQDRTR